MISFLLLVLFNPIPLLSTETLRKGNEVTCLGDIDSPIYLDPPFIGKHSSSTNFLYLKDWEKNNWIIKNDSEIMGPVIDKRWEDFKITKNKVVTMVKSQSFSVHSPSDIILLLTNPPNSSLRKFPLNTTEPGWTHFSIVVANRNVHLSQNGKTVFHKAIDFEPNAITFKRANESYWKFHDYKFRWSNTTTNETPTTLTIPPITKKCLMVYAYLCETCSLRIPEFNLTYTFSGSENGLNSWQTDRIDITPKEETKISLVKAKTDGNEDGYWGIYIAECPEIIDNKTVYRENVPMDANNSTILCRHLDAQRWDENNISKENQTCEPGKFGNDCIISCKDILGVDEQYCQKYKICHESKCECAWGYKGSECDSECEKGHWGLSCNGTCQEGCETCNHITGECTDNTNNGTIIGSKLHMILHFIKGCWFCQYFKCSK
jgi:hypothetical protein